jgi:hypothetical protein
MSVQKSFRNRLKLLRPSTAAAAGGHTAAA